MGRIRMQFWRDTVNRLFEGRRGGTGGAGEEPVGVLLAHVLETTGLSRGFLLKMVATREGRLGDPPFADLEQVAAYGEGTYSQLLYLTAESLAGQVGADAPSLVALDHVSSHVGKALGIATVLRGLPVFVGRHRQVPLPLDVCLAHGLRHEDVLREAGAGGVSGATQAALENVVFDVATHANDHLITARTMLRELGDRRLTDAWFAPLLAAVPLALQLERLEAANFDPFSPRLRRREWTLPWRAYRAYQTKTI
ncbi:Squalene/phytoene synthase [Dipodascopsis tothii]|uniref:Squalene/phytoene synthase n=1 Tax=Dipodascopsis tothii TaxID=44089 RepID=UPI0034CE877F